jgi:hypothetical protein
MKRSAVSMALLLAAGMAEGQGMDDVNMTLAVDAGAGSVRVTVQMENRGARPVYVPRAVAAATQLDGRLFDVRDARTGQEVPYQGRMVKRGPLGTDDFVVLAPHATHRHTIDITPAYAFQPGMHDYHIAYAGNYGADVQALAGGTAAGRLHAPAVRFSFRPGQ